MRATGGARARAHASRLQEAPHAVMRRHIAASVPPRVSTRVFGVPGDRPGLRRSRISNMVAVCIRDCVYSLFCNITFNIEHGRKWAGSRRGIRHPADPRSRAGVGRRVRAPTAPSPYADRTSAASPVVRSAPGVEACGPEEPAYPARDPAGVSGRTRRGGDARRGLSTCPVFFVVRGRTSTEHRKRNHACSASTSNVFRVCTCAVFA